VPWYKEIMAASRFSSDVLEMFYESISREENARLRPPIRPKGNFDFELVRTIFNEWLRVWKMAVPEACKYKADLLRFAIKTKSRFGEVIENEIKTLKSVKMQFPLNVKFSITRDDEKYKKGTLFQTERPRGFQQKQRNNSKQHISPII